MARRLRLHSADLGGRRRSGGRTHSNDAPTFSGCLLQVRMPGADLSKKNGVENNRLVACPKRHKGVALKTDAFHKLSDVPKDTMSGIERFLVDYSRKKVTRLRSKAPPREAMPST